MTDRALRAALADVVTLPWRANPALTVVVALSTVAAGTAPAAAAWLTKLLLESVTSAPAAAGRVTVLALLLGLVAALSATVLYATGHAVNALRHRVALVLVAELFDRVGRFSGLRHVESPAFHDDLRLAEQATEEVPGVLVGFGQELFRAVVVLATLTGVVVALWPPAGALLGLSAVASFGAHVATGRRQADAAMATASAYRRRLFYRDLLTDVRAAKETRLFGLGALLRDRMVDAFRTGVRAELAAERRAVTVQSLLSVGVSVVNAGALVAVAGMVSAGRATVGDLALFLAAQASVQGALAGVVVQAGEAARVLRLFGRYRDIVTRPDDLTSGTRVAPPLRGGVELRDIWFRYDETQPWVLRGVSLVVPAGASVGLVGLNGAGKSTLVKLLCRFYDPQHGEILWDGVPLREYDVASLRRRVGATFQDYMTYDLTAAENIALGAPDRLDDRAAVVAAARAASVHETIAALPRGYDTLLTRTFEDGLNTGVTLSGGQWQRVAVARALLRTDADLFVLDEPTSGLDADAEESLRLALRQATARRTTVLASHRLNALRDASLIVLLAEGRIAESGTHAELVAKNGRYAQLFRLQARGYVDDALAGASP